MEKNKAIKANKILIELEKAEKRLKLFASTKEFCKIIFIGEDGFEFEHEFIYDRDSKEVKEIRDYTYSLLMSKVSKLNKELDEL